MPLLRTASYTAAEIPNAFQWAGQLRNLPIPMCDLDPHLIHGSLGPRVGSLPASRSVELFLHSTSVCPVHRQTRATSVAVVHCICGLNVWYEMRLQQIQSDGRRWYVGWVWRQSASGVWPAAGWNRSTVKCWWQRAGSQCKLHAAASDGNAAAAARGTAESTDAQTDVDQCPTAAATEQPVRQLSTISMTSCPYTCYDCCLVHYVLPTLTVAGSPNNSLGMAKLTAYVYIYKRCVV